MGLFDKKYCDICGEKIGLLGNRKLEDGNLCKDCARKLSPFFSERRSSTVEDIKRQLAYRAENEKKLAGFAPSITFDGSKKVYIDPIGERFIVTGASNWRSSNPDLIAFSQVVSSTVFGSIPLIFAISSMGWMVPISLLAYMMVTSAVSSRMAASTSSGFTRPSWYTSR